MCSVTRYPRILLSTLCMLTSSYAMAQQFVFPDRHFSNKKNIGAIQAHGLPDTVQAETDMWTFMYSNPTWFNTYKIKSVHDFAKFYVDNDTVAYVSDPYYYQIALRVLCFYDPSHPNNYTEFKDTLAISSTQPDSAAAYQDKHFKKFSSYHKIMLVVTDILDWVGNPAAPVSLYAHPTHVFHGYNADLEAEIWQQRYDKSPYGSSYPNVSTNVTSSHNTAKNTLKVNFWDTTALPKPTPAMYELEWTYVDDYAYTFGTGAGTLSTSQLNYDFKNNATRIITDQKSFDIPIVYERGYLVFRARIVRPDSSTFDAPVYTGWSLTSNSGTISSLTSGTNYYHISQSHASDSLNWQYTVSFAEGGKYKQVMNYFDGSLRNRQTITKFNSQPDYTIATENIYDFKGRPSITILPTPVPDSNFRYIYGLDLNSATGNPYKPADFDTLPPPGLCPSEFSLSPLDSTSWAYIYYSPRNGDKTGFQKFIPDAQGYPMVHTIITSENDKRIYKQGGAGEKLQMADSNTTNYDYVMPEQSELNRLFGTEIGWSEYYKKTVVRDPNRQRTYSISDNEGRTVATGVIGLGPDSSTHPIDPYEVPGATTIKENLLDGITQTPVDHIWSLDKSFYVEAEGDHTVQYTITVPPFPVCGGDEYLTIGANYKYKVFDQCGDIKMSQADTLGVTGEWHSLVTNTLTAADETAYLGVGTYYLDKEMTYSLDSISVAIDKFLADTSTCLHNEDYFIRKAVESKDFPCQLDTTNPCEAKRRQMISELWPGAKYGQYQPGFGDTVVASLNAISPSPLPQTGSSIFDYFCLSYPPPGVPYVGPQEYCAYRYQWCPGVTFPSSVWKNGRQYTNIAHLPVDTFIYIFNDTIAEALLPLHPEYCKKCDSTADNYDNLLRSIPDYTTAVQLGYFTLSDIITQDPFYQTLQANLTPTQAFDSLAFPRGSDRRMDSICIALAFCGGIDTTQSRICYEQIFNSEVASGTYDITTAPPAIQDNYFNKLIPFYLANRSMRAKILSDLDTAVHCAPCDSFRMLLVPPGVYGPAVYSPTTTDSAMWATLFTGLDSGPTFPSWMFAALTGNQDSVTLDSVTQLYNSYQLSFCDTQVAQIARKLINCSTDTNVINHIRDSLYNYYCVGAGFNTPFSPEIIQGVIINYAGSVNDLCNPYLVNMNPLPQSQTTGGSFTCKTSGFYIDADSFFVNSAVVSAVNTGTTQRLSLSPSNTFENGLIGVLGLVSPYTINISYEHLASNFYRLKLADSTNASDTMSFWFKKSSPVGLCATALDSLNFWSVRNVSCLENNATTILPSLINGFTFNLDVLSVIGTDTTVCRVLMWNDRMALMDTVIQDGPDCIACSEIKAVYDGFQDTLNAYGVCCSDHPYYSTMLWNYVNYTMKRQYAGSDIEDFIASCALADSTAFRYLYGQFKLSGISANSIQTIVSHLNTTYNTSVDFFKYKDNAASTYDLVLSFGNIPTEDLLRAKNYIVNDSAGLSYTYRYGKSLNNDTLGIIYVPSDINTASWLPALATAMGTDLSSVDSSNVTVVFSADPAATTLSYKKHVIKNVSGLPFYKLVQYSDTLNKILYVNTYGVQTFTAYNPFINLDYYKQEKKDFLSYNYGLGDSVHYMIIRKLSADSLKTNIANYASKNVTYENPYVTNDDGDLFISTNQFADPGFAIADSIIACVTRPHNVADPFYQPTANALFFANVHQRIYPPAPGPASHDSLNVYRCGDNKTYWYRYFKHNKLYDMYIQIPDFIQTASQWRYYPGSFQVGQGDGYIYRFNVSVVNAGYPGLKVKLYGYTDFAMGTILDMKKSMLCLGIYDGEDMPDTTSCERYTLNDAVQEGKHNYIIYKDSVKQKVTSDYIAFLDTAIHESMYLTSRDQKYQFTMYYHDRAGNLTRTVPPSGVSRMDSTMSLNDSINDDRRTNTIEAATLPFQHMASFYTYNSINNVVQQITPDGGTVNYYYDAVGRVVFSQNDVQRPWGTVSYTLYDPQGRIIETGEMYAACPATCGSCIPGLLQQITNSSNFSLLDLYNFIVGSRRSQVVATRYDDEYQDLSAISGMTRQQNLRKRVSTVKFIPLLAAHELGNNVSSYTHAAYYSYDIEGNVKTLTHDYPDMPIAAQRYKRIDYDYDMLSGKVNMLSYNRGFGDQFYQRYSYDADNRLTKAETSKDAVYWDDDADYQYYKHGPVARIEYGDRRVQAMDYAYTLQGWVKALNGDIRDTAYDMGGDGRKNSIFPPDVFAYALDYFPEDYKPIGDSLVMHIPNVTKGLYNGNIGRQTTSMQPVPPLVKEYRYDPLNRITNAQYYDVDSSHYLLATDAYKSHYTYNPDGRFKTLNRYGGSVLASLHVGVIMDSFTYYYNYQQNNLFTVKDSADNHYGNIDIQKSGYEDLPRFYYDDIGRLIRDNKTIPTGDSIHWSLYNKVTELGMDGVPRMRFSYDGTGNRLTKTNYGYTDTTSSINTDYYVRDPSGNILAVMNYEEDYALERVPIIIFWENVLAAVGNNHLVVGPYMTDPHFRQAVERQVAARAADILGPIGPAQIINIDPSTVLNPCINIIHVIDVVYHAGPGPIVHATELETPLDLSQHIFLPFDVSPIITMDTTGGDTTYTYSAGSGRAHTALDYWITEWPQGFDSLCHLMGIDVGDTLITDSIRYVNEDSLLIFKTGFADYAGMLLGGDYDSTNFSRRDSLVFAWFADSSLYYGDLGTSSGIGGSSGGTTVGSTLGTVTGTNTRPDWSGIQWEALLRHLYDSTALADSDKAVFAADMVDSGMDISHLLILADTVRLLDLAYSYQPDSFINFWLSSASDTDVATALSAMPNMTAARGLHDMNNLPDIHVDVATALRNVVVGQRFGLSEHHLYGTQRLAIRDYALQFGSSWQWNDTIPYVTPDSSYVNMHVPWYSRAMGDFMQNNVSEPLWTHLDYGKWYTTRILGLKRYELTSHLGDVQSTVLDRTTRIWAGVLPSLYIARTHADISTYTDYYPFGMIMPGRYVINDTALLDTAQVPYNPNQFVMYNDDSSMVPESYPPQQALSLDMWSLWPQDSIVTGHLDWLGSGNGLAVYCDTTVDSISGGKFGTKLFIPTDSGTSYTVKLTIENGNAGILGAVAYADRPSSGSLITTLATQAIHSSGAYTLHFSAVSDSTWVAIGSPAMDSGTHFRVAAAKKNNAIEVVANGFLIPGYYGKKNYRFGYDAQEKVNEISGEGNHYTALFWEYDPRTALRWNIDPIVKEWESPYAAFRNSPIAVTDILGNDGKTAWALWMSTHELAGETILVGGGPEDVVADGVAVFEEIIGGAMSLWELTKDAPVNIPPAHRLPTRTPSSTQPVVRKVDDKQVKAPDANGGLAKPHGGKKHDEAINNHIAKLKNKPNVSNIRKNQQQVDKHGNKVGNNRPDIQYDEDGEHTNVEYDNSSKNSEKHSKVIKGNDPDAKTELNILPKDK